MAGTRTQTEKPLVVVEEEEVTVIAALDNSRKMRAVSIHM